MNQTMTETNKAEEEQESTYEIRNGYMYFRGNDRPIGREVRVVAFQTNIDTAEVGIFLEFEDNGEKVTRRIFRSDLTKSGLAKLTRYGADTWHDIADFYVEYLREQIKKVRRSFIHSTMGWSEYDDAKIFKHHKAVGLDSVYDGAQHEIEPHGSYENWVSLIEQEVLGNFWLEFALVAGLTAPLVSLLGERAHIDSLFFNYVGVSSTGKTLATRLGLSPWGLPDSRGNGLLKLWYGTDQAIISNLAGNFGVPIGIDDTSLQDREKNFTTFIYQAVVGKEKQALNPDGTARKRGEWNTTIISSAEQPMLKHADQKSGLRVRLFEVAAPAWTTSAQNAETIEKGILENYGHAGFLFVQYLMGLDWDELFDQWERAKELLLQYMDKDPFSKRIVGKLAIVLLTGKLVRQGLGLSLNLEELAKTLLTIEQKSVKSRDVGDQAYRFLIDYFMRNRNRFFEDSRRNNLYFPGGCLGKYLKTGDRITEIRIPKDGHFARVMEEGKFGEIDQIIDNWKQKGLLVHESGKNFLLRVFEPGMPRVPLYAVKVMELAEEQSDENEVVFDEKMLGFLSEWESGGQVEEIIEVADHVTLGEEVNAAEQVEVEFFGEGEEEEEEEEYDEEEDDSDYDDEAEEDVSEVELDDEDSTEDEEYDFDVYAEMEADANDGEDEYDEEDAYNEMDYFEDQEEDAFEEAYESDEDELDSEELEEEIA